VDVVFPLLVAAAAASWALHLLFRGNDTEHSILDDWREAARKMGLTDVEDSRDALGGWSGQLDVQFSRYSDTSAHGTRITVSGPGLPPDLTVRPEGLGTGFQSARGAREIEIGHDAFDAAAWVQGRPALVRALLDPDARRAIRALFDGRLERPGRSPFWATGRIDEGVLRVDVPEVVPRGGQDPDQRAHDAIAQGAMPAVGNDYVARPEQLGDVLAAVLALARRLAPPADVARHLADNLKTEPVAGVRLQCLATLVREFPDHPATRDALLAAREDPDAEVRLRAGIFLGSEGRETLLGVAGGEGAEDDTTARAVAALGGHLTTPQAQGLLRSALRTRREATARACLAALARRRGAAVATLAKVLAIETPGLASAAAEALGETADATAEAPLLAALASPHAVVRVAAARALGRVGTAAAVQPLKEAEALDRATSAAARQAIAEIQARLKGAAPGQLSLAGGEAGQLSLASDEQGRLSLAALSSRGTSVPAGPEGSAGAETADPSSPRLDRSSSG
jgi:hypothetical protein